MPRFAPGDFLPKFTANSSLNPAFNFDSVSGRRLILVFLGSAGTDLGRSIVDMLIQHQAFLKRHRLLLYVVTADPRDRDDERLAGFPKHYTVFWDFDRAIHRLYGMEVQSQQDGAPVALRVGAFMIRENLRMHSYVTATAVDVLAARLKEAAASFPAHPAPQTVTMQAPVLIIPDVVERSFCRRLIDYYEAAGGSPSGFMRDVDGRTRGVLDDRMKRRKDCYIADEPLLKPIRDALRTKIAPEIHKAFGVAVTRVERHLIGCYDETDNGFFGSHRDNVSKATSHRQFAMSLNLNSEEFDGGTLRFPEYSQHHYKPNTGSAVIFSCSLLHEAMPVTRGRRYVLLPFLYDDAHARIRAENLQFLDRGPATSAQELTAA